KAALARQLGIRLVTIAFGGSFTADETGLLQSMASSPDDFYIASTTELSEKYSKIANSVCRSIFAPSVNAGPDRWVWIDDGSVHLAGIPSAAASGQTPGQTLAWSLVSGPGHVTFGTASQGNSSVSFSLPGVYILRLTLTIGSASYTDDVEYTVR